MLAFFAFLLSVVGCLNWLSIGILQFDFVAGIFGSQSSILSRIIYLIVGIASIIMVVQLIKGKGTFKISFKKAKGDFTEMMQKPSYSNAEQSADNSKHNNYVDMTDKNYNDYNKPQK